MSKLTETLIKIVELQNEIDSLRKESGNEFEDCCYWETGNVIKNCTEKDDCLYDENGDCICRGGLVDDTYYCDQTTGWCEDDYRGTMYYKTDQPGVFVSVHYEC